MDLRVGTSGYSYKEWKGSFYPEDLKPDGFLAHYATKLPSVEINNTFYRLPRTSVLETWASQVPDEFRFAIKASRRITHMKRLKEVGEETGYLMETLAALGPKLGVVLFQLPPNFKKDLDRLTAFLELLPPGARPVLEFRHETWFEDDVYEALRERNCALCMSDTDEAPIEEIVSTAGFGYLRLRKAAYETAELERWMEMIKGQPWGEAYVYFKHEDEGTGPRLAGEFLGLG